MRKLLHVLLVAAFFNALSWIILIPIWQYPDEQAHFAQVQGLAEIGKVPSVNLDTSYEIALSEKILGTERDGFGNNKFTYHPEHRITYSGDHNGPFESVLSNLPVSSRTNLVKRESTSNPPAYYLLSALVYKLFYHGNLFSRVFVIRIFSALIFMTMIFFAYKIGRTFFIKQPYLQLILPSIAAFKPMLVFSSTGILPDSLVNLLFTMIVFLSLKILKEGLQKKIVIFLIAIIIIGVMTRQQFLLSLPIILMSLVFRAILTKRDRKPLVIVFFLTMAVIFFSTMFGRGILLISSFRIHEFTSIKFNELFKLEFASYLIQVAKHSYEETFAWYWGVYKWLSLTLPLIYYRLIKIILVISMVGVLAYLYKKFRNGKLNLESSYLLLFISSSLLYLLILIIWDYFFARNSGYSFGLQGRYFFPLIVADLAIITVGFIQVCEVVLKKYLVFSSLFLVISMIIFNDLSLFHVSSSYYDTSTLSTFLIQASQYKPLFFKGNMIILILAISFALQLSLIVLLAKYATKKFNQDYQ